MRDAAETYVQASAQLFNRIAQPDRCILLNTNIQGRIQDSVSLGGGGTRSTGAAEVSNLETGKNCLVLGCPSPDCVECILDRKKGGGMSLQTQKNSENENGHT